MAGDHFGVILWDFSTFFDTLSFAHLRREGAALAFPEGDLALALQMHAGERRLTACGAASEAILAS